MFHKLLQLHECVKITEIHAQNFIAAFYTNRHTKPLFQVSGETSLEALQKLERELAKTNHTIESIRDYDTVESLVDFQQDNTIHIYYTLIHFRGYCVGKAEATGATVYEVLEKLQEKLKRHENLVLG